MAVTAWKFSALMNTANLENWRSIIPTGDSGGTTDSKRQLFGSSTLNDNHVTQETANRSGGATPLQVHSYDHQFKLQNRNKHPCFIDIWDVSLKESTHTNANSDPEGLLGLYASNEGSAPYYYAHGGTLSASMTYTHPDFKLGYSKEFVDVWTKKHHTRVRLQPGEEHIHTVKAHLQFVYDKYSLDNNGITEFGGITQGCLFRATGDMVHDTDAVEGTYLPTIDGTYVDIIEVWKVNISQVDPWRDTFHLNISTIYPAAGHGRETVARVELENPTETTGTQTGS